jgi:hypothetical protein
MLFAAQGAYELKNYSKGQVYEKDFKVISTTLVRRCSEFYLLATR